MPDTVSPESRARRRQAWPFYLAIGLILAAIPVGYFVFLGEEKPVAVAAPPPPPPAPAPVKETQLTLSKMEGTVEIRRQNGDWMRASEGQTLQRADTVRTQENATAVLLDGDRYQVKMESSTELSVEELTDSISRVQLGSGMATAEVKAGKHTFEVRAVGSDAVARTTGGTFAISNNGAGTVAVGTHSGEVEFAGHGKMVIVRAGQQSVVRPGEAPSDPAAVPSSLLLKVQWPASATLTTKKIVLTGQTEPGARVEVGGHAVAVDQRGKWVKTVSLEEGKNGLEVRARSVGRLEQQLRKELDVDTHAPSFNLRHGLWDSPKK